jgi:hypothetical protein
MSKLKKVRCSRWCQRAEVKSKFGGNRKARQHPNVLKQMAKENDD